jgi:hypothetical protein
LDVPDAIAADGGQRSKRRPTLLKGWPQIGRDHAKIILPAQRRWSQKSGF